MSYQEYFKEPSKDASLEEKIEIIKSNRASALNILRKLQDCKRIALPNEVEEELKSKSTIPALQPKLEDKDATTAFDKLNFLAIENLSSEKLQAEIQEIIKNLNESSISRIKLLLYKELMFYSHMLLTSSTTEEKAEIERLIYAVKIKIEALDELEEEQDLSPEELDASSTINNNIFFLLSPTGNNLPMENIRKTAPTSYSAIFKELIMGIRTGNFKNVKRLKNRGYYEVKLYEARITFDKLSNGSYIIIDGFMKKFMNNDYHKKRLDLRTKNYKNQKAFYLEKHRDPEFIAEHERYLEEFLSMLDKKLLEGDEPNEGRAI